MRKPMKQLSGKYPLWLLVAWIAAAVALSLLLHPISSWRDGPEFSLTSWILGIAHPAGFPLYNAIVWMWDQIPLGNIAFRSHTFSLFATMLATIALYHVALSFIRQLYKRDNTPADQNIAGFITLCWLVMPSQIENAVQAEVYSLHAFFTFIVIKLLIDYVDNQQPRYLVLASFLAGIGAGNHVTLGVLIFALIIAASTASDWQRLIKNAGTSIMAGVFGLTIYLYLPVRSLQNPTFDWGNTEIWERFWNHVTDKKDSSTHFSSILNTETHQGMDHFLALYDWVGAITIIVVLIGWVWIAWRKPRPALLILPWVSILFIFFLGWTSSTVLTGALGMLLLGLIPVYNAILSQTHHPRLSGVAIIGISAAIFMPIFNASVSFTAQRGNFLSREIVASEYFSIPYRATILTGRGSFHLLSLAHLEGARPDVSIASLAYIFSPNHFRPMMPYDIPLLSFPTTSLPESGDTADEFKLQFLYELIDTNAPVSSFYAELDEDYLTTILGHIQADKGLLAKVSRTQTSEIDCAQTRKVIMGKLLSLHESKELLNNIEAERFLSPQIFSWLNHQLSSSDPQCAASALNLGLWWLRWMNPDQEAEGPLYNDFGISFARLGYDQSARNMFLSSWATGFTDGRINLGVWYEKHGNYKQALHHYKESFIESGNEKAYLAMRNLIRKNNFRSSN